jgi:hypothetical protein
MLAENPMELENDLPAKLQCLGEQLSADAAFLAARYPATAGPRRSTAFEAVVRQALDMADDRLSAEATDGAADVNAYVEAPHEQAKEGSRGSTWALIMAGGCATVILIAIASWQSHGRDSRDQRMADRRSSSTSTAAPHQFAEVADEGAAEMPGGMAGRTSRTTDNVLEGLSGAEQEAVLDLLENRSERDGSLSI